MYHVFLGSSCYTKTVHILVTGGAGYIGSHTVVELLNGGYEVTVVDNLSNSSRESLKRVEKICDKPANLHVFDLCDTAKLKDLFSKNKFDGVIHFAGLKAVGESTKKPLLYYRTNIDASLSLLEVMDEYSVRKLVFSSSATVYGSAPIPYAETSTTGQGITNPYGQTKYVIEKIIADATTANTTNEFTILRYFNPIGSHKSGQLGEDPQGIPNNLMPYVAQVATGKRPLLHVFGNDYPTPDGTGVRDYIHVVDLAKGHIAALQHSQPGVDAYNLGSGHGTSVLELIEAFEKASGKNIPYQVDARRPGDLPEYYADATKALRNLGWKTSLSVEDACRDTWLWQSKNPNGY